MGRVSDKMSWVGPILMPLEGVGVQPLSDNMLSHYILVLFFFPSNWTWSPQKMSFVELKTYWRKCHPIQMSYQMPTLLILFSLALVQLSREKNINIIPPSSTAHYWLDWKLWGVTSHDKKEICTHYIPDAL